MILQFLIALSFLTRFPMPQIDCTAKEIGRSARWFPVAGALLGAIYAGVERLASPFFPPLVRAVLITATDAVLTGAMHFDGLADTADGFGGGRTRDDVLRIMRDHAIGSYGACALILVIGLKVIAIGALAGTPAAFPALLLAPVLGRWSAVLSSVLGGYARQEADGGANSVGSPARFMGHTELIIASAITVAVAVAVQSWRGTVALLLLLTTMAVWMRICRRRIGGVTGDTLGAGIEWSECLVFIVFTMKW